MGGAPRRRKRERGGEREAELREHVGLLVWAGKDRRADQSRRLRLRYSPPLPGLPALSAPSRAASPSARRRVGMYSTEGCRRTSLVRPHVCPPSSKGYV